MRYGIFSFCHRSIFTVCIAHCVPFGLVHGGWVRTSTMKWYPKCAHSLNNPVATKQYTHSHNHKFYLYIAHFDFRGLMQSNIDSFSSRHFSAAIKCCAAVNIIFDLCLSELNWSCEYSLLEYGQIGGESGHEENTDQQQWKEFAWIKN